MISYVSVHIKKGEAMANETVKGKKPSDNNKKPVEAKKKAAEAAPAPAKKKKAKVDNGEPHTEQHGEDNASHARIILNYSAPSPAEYGKQNGNYPRAPAEHTEAQYVCPFAEKAGRASRNKEYKHQNGA